MNNIICVRQNQLTAQSPARDGCGLGRAQWAPGIQTTCSEAGQLELWEFR